MLAMLLINFEVINTNLASAKTRPEPRKRGSSQARKPVGYLLFKFSESFHILAHPTRISSCAQIDFAASDAMALSSRGARREVV